jgi:hypothetical protein
MRSNLFALGLAIALGLGSPIVSAVVMPEGAIAQQANTSEIDRAIAEGNRLLDEGNAESLRQAIAQFEIALKLARSANAQDKQALSLLKLGRIHTLSGEKQSIG